MAFPWMLALKVIPWGDVIEHAPKVLKGARKLLDRQQGDGSHQAGDPAADPAADTARWAAMEAEQQRLQADLRQLAQTTAEVAEQNAQLIAAVEVLRWRTRWLGAISVVLLIALPVLWWALG